jgi:hypothetical protein
LYKILLDNYLLKFLMPIDNSQLNNNWISRYNECAIRIHATAPEEEPLIEEGLTSFAAHAGPPPQWLDGGHRQRPPGAAEKHQIGEPLKEEYLIVGYSEHPPPPLPQLPPLELDSKDEERRAHQIRPGNSNKLQH